MYIGQDWRGVRKIFIDRVDAGEDDWSQLTCHFIPPPPPSISAAAAALVSILLLAPSGSFNPLDSFSLCLLSAASACSLLLSFYRFNMVLI